MLVTGVLGFSILLQLYAAVLALRLVRVTGHRVGWALIAAAVFLMAARRSITFVRLVRGDMAHPPDLQAEIVALFISIFMVSGLFLVAPFFRSIRETERTAGKVNRELRALSEVNEAVLKVKSEAALLSEACRIVVETGGYKLAWVGYAGDDEDKTVYPVAHCGFEDGYLETVRISWADDESGRGPTGTAIRTGEPSIIRDIRADPRYTPWRAQAEKRGYASSAAIPLLVDGKTLGALNVYSEEAGVFDDDEIELLQKIATDLAGAVTAIKAREESEAARRMVFESEARLDAITSAAQDAIVMLDDEGKIRFWNPAAERMFGYTWAEVNGEDITGLTVPEKYRERHRRGFEGFIKEGKGPIVGNTVEFTGQRRDGSEFPITLSVSAIQLNGRWNAVGVVRDITEQKKNEEELRRRTQELGERVKEMRCLYGVSSLVRSAETDPEKVMPRVVELLPPGWQYPDITCARIVLEGREYKTANYSATRWRQSADITAMGEKIGELEVRYLEAMPEMDEGPFLKEERDLINALADVIGRAVEEGRAARAIKASEEKYRNLFEYANEGIMMVDPETFRIIEANEVAASRLGYTREEFLKLTVNDINPPGYDPARDIPLKDLREGKSVIFERRHRRKNGSILHAEVSAKLVDYDGRKAIQGFVRDISGRKAAEEALMESERALAALMGNLPGMAYRCLNDRDWTMEFVSEGCLDLTGYKVSDMLGNRIVSYADLIHPDDREMVWKEVQEAIRKGESYTLMYRITTADGQLRWVWEKGAAVRSGDGDVEELEGFISDITALKRAEEALSESESRLRVITDTAIDSIIQMDDEGRITFWNKAAERMFGYSPEEAIGQDLHRLLAPERYYDDFSKAFDEFKTSGTGPLTERVTEIGAVRKSGEEFPVEIAIASVRLGGKWHAVGVVRDASARKRMEDWLVKLSMAIDTAPTIVMITGAEGRVEYVNPSFTTVTGYEPDEIIGRSAGDLGGMAPEESERMWAALRERGEWQGEFYNRKKDGGRYWERATISAVRDRDGGIVNYLKVAEDVTERREAEDKLKEAGEFLRRLLDTIPNPLFYKNTEGVYIGCNEAFAKYLGLERDEIIGKTVYDIAPKDLADVYEDKDRLLFENPGVQTYETRVRGRDGKRRDAVFSKATYTDAKGAVAGLVGVIIDITERKEWETSLQETNERLQSAFSELRKAQTMLIRQEKLASMGALSAGVAHEIKNPLNIISTSVQLLMMEEGIPDDVMKSYRTIMDQVKRAVKITDNLRDFARERKPEVTDIDLGDFLEKTIALVEYEMRTESIEITRIFDPETMAIKGDPDQLAQVFLNIIGNARESMNEKRERFSYDRLSKMGWRGRLSISTRVMDGEVRIAFRDSGMGLSKEAMEKVFDPFFTTKPEGKGTGLGMAIAYGIIENHGGRIEADSAPGEWAEFAVYLPIAGRGGK
ncbi:MAG: PAS domain S-box protein [Candidatus Nitrospinota bacterium M3_3B_026]